MPKNLLEVLSFTRIEFRSLVMTSMVLHLQRVTETQNTVKLTDRMWARLLASTNQPSFLGCNEASQEKVDGETIDDVINNTSIASS